MIGVRILFPLNIFRTNEHNLTKLCICFDMLGLFPVIFFFKFVWPLLDAFCSMKSATAGLLSDSLTILVWLFFLFTSFIVRLSLYVIWLVFIYHFYWLFIIAGHLKRETDCGYIFYTCMRNTDLTNVLFARRVSASHPVLINI